MPSSKPNILNASSIQELLDQLNFVINDIYSQIDIARGLDNQGEIVPLSRGGLEKDVSGYAGLVQITGGAAVEINASNTIPGTYLPAMSATARGGVPATGTPSGKFLKDDGTFAAVPLSSLVVDVSFNDATKGVILKDTQATPHFWRVTVDNTGSLVTTDLGTSIP